jgi:hypothetical protein
MRRLSSLPVGSFFPGHSIRLNEDFRQLLTEIVWICEEILDAEEGDAVDAPADPKEFVRSLLYGPQSEGEPMKAEDEEEAA